MELDNGNYLTHEFGDSVLIERSFGDCQVNADAGARLDPERHSSLIRCVLLHTLGKELRLLD